MKGHCIIELSITMTQTVWIIVLITLFIVCWIHFLLTAVINQNYMKYAEQNYLPYQKPESKDSKKRTRCTQSIKWQKG